MADLPTLSLDIGKPPAETRVVVAMSGGVDSSVAAGLLRHAGYDVVGITLQLYDHGAAIGRKGACCAGADIDDARRVAERLKIPHYVLDYEERFREAVMEDFAQGYAAGRTPIPCVRCNERVKFRDLAATAREIGADALATGHYVRRVLGPRGPELRRAADAERDQSYFLFATTRDQLDFLHFPLGDLTKAETRRIAACLDLPVAEKPDSQDICFVPAGHYAAAVERLRPGAAEPGPIVHRDGRVLGRHRGIIHFTVGQRRGLEVIDPAAPGEPLYVLRLDAPSRLVVVGPRDALGVTGMTLDDVTWLDDALPKASGRNVSVKLRSAMAPAPATVKLDAGSGSVFLHRPVRGVAPGQACVFYDGDRVLGGGWIAATQAAAAA
jgi:tRNA-specific 2-thiouridylase